MVRFLNSSYCVKYVRTDTRWCALVLLFGGNKAGSVVKCAFHQQPAVPRSASMVDVSLRTAANVREAGEAMTVPVVWNRLFPVFRRFLTLSPLRFLPSLSLFFSFELFPSGVNATQTKQKMTTGPSVKWLIFLSSTPSNLSSGSSEGALHAQQCVICGRQSPETILLEQRETEQTNKPINNNSL